MRRQPGNGSFRGAQASPQFTVCKHGKDLARGPGERTATQDVDVEVRDGFAAVRAVVDHEAEAGGEVEFTGHRAGGEQQVTEQRLVIGRSGADAGDDLFRDDEEVGGRLRRDVVEDDAEVVLVLDLGGDFSGDNALEKSGHGGRRWVHRGLID